MIYLSVRTFKKNAKFYWDDHFVFGAQAIHSSITQSVRKAEFDSPEVP